MRSSSHSKLIFSIFLLIALLVISNGQFFTKTSKSIPRMGRRADNSFWSMGPQQQAYKRQLISEILRKYNETNKIEIDNSITTLSSKLIDKLDSNQRDLLLKNINWKSASLQVEDSDDPFNTNTEMRKIQKMLNSLLKKLHNNI